MAAVLGKSQTWVTVYKSVFRKCLSTKSQTASLQSRRCWKVLSIKSGASSPSHSQFFFTHSFRHYSVDDSNSSSQKLGVLSPKLHIIYTCKVCGSRNNHSFSRTSYEKGVVIVQCSCCKNNHLIADNLGWFDDIKERNIEEILASKGETVNKFTDVDLPSDILDQLKNPGEKK